MFLQKDIGKFHIEHDVKMVRFKGNNRLKILDKYFSESSIFKLIKEFELFFEKNTRTGRVVEGFKGIDIPEYPLDAVREAFINAIAHHDYNIRGGCVTFYIYYNRIEIISPGGLIYPLTVKNLGIEMSPEHRNKILCKILENTIYMEKVGTGISRIR